MAHPPCPRTTTQGTDIEVPDALAGKHAWLVAELIAFKDGNVRLAKDRWWNACEHGTREETCDHFGWSYSSMSEYGRYAREFDAIASISYSHWKNTVVGGIKKTDRPALLQKAADNDWTPKELTEHIRSTQASY